MRGELLLKLRPPDIQAAEGAFNQAIEIARSQRTRTLSLAKLCRSTRRNSGVRELLAAAVMGFTEGPEVPEVAEVNACGNRSTNRLDCMKNEAILVG